MTDKLTLPELDPHILELLVDWDMLPTLDDDDPEVIIEHPTLTEDGECYLTGRTFEELREFHNALSGYIEYLACLQTVAAMRATKIVARGLLNGD